MDLLFPGGSRGSHALLPEPSPSLMEAGVWSAGLGAQGMCGRIPSAEGPRPSPGALRKGNVGAASPLRPQTCTPSAAGLQTDLRLVDDLLYCAAHE